MSNGLLRSFSHLWFSVRFFPAEVCEASLPSQSVLTLASPVQLRYSPGWLLQSSEITQLVLGGQKCAQDAIDLLLRLP